MVDYPPQPQPSVPPAPEQPAHVATPEESKQELKAAIRESNAVLARATTVLTLFPDTLEIDRTKLTLTKRTFFSTSEAMSIRVEDILNVTATVGPLFGSITIVSRVFNSEKPYHIGRFSRKDVMKLKHILQGYVIALQRKIDCSAMKTAELASMLEKLGEDEHNAT